MLLLIGAQGSSINDVTALEDQGFRYDSTKVLMRDVIYRRPLIKI